MKSELALTFTLAVGAGAGGGLQKIFIEVTFKCLSDGLK